MEDKYAKAIANELKLIRQELQKMNEPKVVGPLVFHSPVSQSQTESESVEIDDYGAPNLTAGERVSF